MSEVSQGVDAYLDAIERDACYRVDAVLKSSPAQTTELVYFVGVNGAEQGPYVRKRFADGSGMGGAYERIMRAQRAGRRFLHLPRVMECHSDGRELSVVMEYVPGETLADVVYRCDPSPALAADLFPRLCDAATELHESFDPPLIHRDLKPSNVVLTADSLTLIDFGIARTYRAGADDDTRHFGTRAYAPPEQFGFGQTSVRSDVYALGMLLFYCLAEQTPSQAVREAGFALQSVPAALRPVLLKATAFDPDARYGSARELKEAFLAASASDSLRPAAEARPATAPLPAPKAPQAPGPGARPAIPEPAPSSPGAAGAGRADGPGAATPAVVRDRLPRPIAPAWLRRAWNAVVLAAAVVWAAACLSCAFAPTTQELLSLPPSVRVVQYAVGGVLLGAAVAWGLACRSRLKRLAAVLPRVLFVHPYRCSAVVLACAVVAICAPVMPLA